jgi:tetratricopeptide (TPR) repeat protein
VLGKDAEAGKLLLEAKDLWPESERAQINETLGFELTGDKVRAHALASERLDAYPSASKLIAIRIRTAPRDCSLEDLELLVTPPHANDAEVCLALALKATELIQFEKAEVYARKAVAASSDWFGPQYILGQALLNGQAKKLGESFWKGPNPLAHDKLIETIVVIDEAIRLARRHQVQLWLADSFLIRAMANMLLGEGRAAENDFNEAMRYGPDSPNIYHRYASYLFNQNRIDEAIIHLRKAISLKPVEEVEYFLAGMLAERKGPGDCREAVEIYVRLALGSDEVPSPSSLESSVENARWCRLAAFYSAIEEFIDSERFDDAESFLVQIRSNRVSEMTVLSSRSKLQLARGDLSGASASANEALRLIVDDTPEIDLRSLALHLGKLERHKEALRLWLRINQSASYGNDVRHLVRCAERAKRFDVILKVAQATRDAGIFDRWLFFKEVDTLEPFDLQKAISLLQERLKRHPDEKDIRLRLSFIGLKWGRPELVDARPEAIPTIAEATPNTGAIAVEILRLHGDPDEALRYAYELVRRNAGAPDANASLIRVFFDPSSKPLSIPELDEVRVGSAVRFVEGDDREQVVIIEDSPNPRQEIGEYPPTHPLSEELLGKRVGDTIILSKTSARDRTAVIKEIVSKYVYRVREVMASWQLRFPDQPCVQVFQVMTTDPATGELVPDFTDLKLVADRRYEQISEIEATYNQRAIPLHLFAHCAGFDPFWVIHFLASKPDLVIRSNHGREDEQAAALEALGASHTLVLDLTALAMTSLFELEKLLKDWRGKLVISQSTATELRSTKETVSSKRGSVNAARKT